MSEAFVYTYKDGLLSSLAHDLRLRVTKHEIGDKVATFDATSLRVDWVGGSLGQHYYVEIETTIREDVLKSGRFPVIRFEATSVGEHEVVGNLTLCGVTKEIRVRRTGNAYEYELDQREFGIKPYTAMLGTLKVKPKVKVQVTL